MFDILSGWGIGRSLIKKGGEALLKTTKHGATRVAGVAATRGGILSVSEIAIAKRAGQKLLQSDGTFVYLYEITPGKYNAVVEGGKGIITTFKNLSEKSIQRLSKNYGWH